MPREPRELLGVQITSPKAGRDAILSPRTGKGGICMPNNKPLSERQGFQEDAPNSTVGVEDAQSESAATYHLAPPEQRALHAALRRSVKVVSH